MINKAMIEIPPKFAGRKPVGQKLGRIFFLGGGRFQKQYSDNTVFRCRVMDQVMIPSRYSCGID